jgi:hypothetical protein
VIEDKGEVDDRGINWLVKKSPTITDALGPPASPMYGGFLIRPYTSFRVDD